MSATPEFRPLAVVTGASSGIGYELACECARHGFDLVIAADRSMHEAAKELRALGAAVETVQVDLATEEGVRALCEAVQHRQVAALLANAGHGLGEAFLDQDFAVDQLVIVRGRNPAHAADQADRLHRASCAGICRKAETTCS